jgi:hypothetical protein
MGPRYDQRSLPGDGAPEGGTMFRIGVVLAAVMLTAPAMWAIASMLADPGTQQVSLATPDQVDTFELMASSHRLPDQSYEAY